MILGLNRMSRRRRSRHKRRPEEECAGRFFGVKYSNANLGGSLRNSTRADTANHGKSSCLRRVPQQDRGSSSSLLQGLCKACGTACLNFAAQWSPPPKRSNICTRAFRSPSTIEGVPDYRNYDIGHLVGRLGFQNGLGPFGRAMERSAESVGRQFAGLADCQRPIVVRFT